MIHTTNKTMTMSDYMSQFDRSEKDTRDICGLMSERNIRMVHATLGMTSELSEIILAATSQDTVNQIEEFGDLMWYNALLAKAVGCKLYNRTEPIASTILEQARFLTNSISTIANQVKRITIYGKCSQKELDILASEISDISAWVSYSADKLGYSMEEVLVKNIEKLKLRYPDKFDIDKCEVRDLTAERAVLENK